MSPTPDHETSKIATS